ncbi:MAG TPA: tetratricopeptide repeat protein, partial [Pyrinomonadaceae bacterium]
MNKPLLPTIFVVLFLFVTVAAQGPTSNPTAEQLAAKPQIAAAITDSGGASNQPVSAESVAEAKRLYKVGTQYGRAGLFKQAAEVLERVVKLNPGHPDAFFSLGHAYFDLGEWDKAVENLQRAVDQDPKDKEARERLNYASMMLERQPPRTRERVATVTQTPATGAPSETSLVAPTSSSLASRISNPELALTKLYRVGPGDVLDVRLAEDAASKSSLFT